MLVEMIIVKIEVSHIYNIPSGYYGF